MSDRYIHTNCTSLAIRDTGKGAPILALHGALSDLRAWDGMRSALDDSYRLVAVTQRYHGIELWQDKGQLFSRETHVADLIALIEEMQLPPVHLLAWSYGGDVGLNAMFKRPDLFASAALFEPSLAGVLHRPKDLIIEQDFLNKLRNLLSNRADASALQISTAFLRCLLGEDPWGGDTIGGEPPQDMLCDNIRTLPLFLERTGRQGLSRDQLGQITSPVTVAYGASSLLRYQRVANAIAEALADAEVCVIEDGTHLAPHALPERTAAFVRHHMETLSGRTRHALPLADA